MKKNTTTTPSAVSKYYEARHSIKGWNIYNKKTGELSFDRYWKTKGGAENAMNKNHIFVQLAAGYEWNEKRAAMMTVKVFCVKANRRTEIHGLKDYPVRGCFSSVVSYALEGGRRGRKNPRCDPRP